jgi:N-acetyltransferase
MNTQPTLQDDLLLLRPLHPSDQEALYAAASDPLIWEQHPADRYLRTVFDPFFQESLDSNGALVAILKETGNIIGTSRYKLFPEIPMAVEIGWTFLERRYWGGHLNGRMKKLMIDHAQAEGMAEVVLKVALKNLRSQKAVEKIGGVRVEDPYPAVLAGVQDYCMYTIQF